LSAFPISRELHAALDAELERLAESDRPVRNYHAADLGLGLIAFVCEHRTYDLSSEPKYTTLIFRHRPRRGPDLLDEYRSDRWPL
jgi:hypothetical protein